MSPNISIRPEQPRDAPIIREVVEQTYAHVGYSDHGEHSMVERLRDSPAFVPELSLVAEVDGVCVGHVMLTKVKIVDKDHHTEALALAPLSVIPAFQGQGVGSRLVREAHTRAAALGYGLIVLVGNATYYPRFGYQSLEPYPITLPFLAPARNRMILPLHPGALKGVQGQVEYAPEWLEH